MDRVPYPEVRSISVWDRLWAIPLLILAGLFITMGVAQYNIALDNISQYSEKTIAIIIETYQVSEKVGSRYYHEVMYFDGVRYTQITDNDHTYHIAGTPGLIYECRLNPAEEGDILLPELYPLPKFVLYFFCGLGSLMVIMAIFVAFYKEDDNGSYL